MTNNEEHDIKIDKSHEPRTKEISKMIGEGGLGADKYYKIKKNDPDHHNIEVEKTKGVEPEEVSDMVGEGGTGAEEYYDEK